MCDTQAPSPPDKPQRAECWVDRVFPRALYTRDDELIVAWDGSAPSFVELYGPTGWQTVTARSVEVNPPRGGL